MWIISKIYINKNNVLHFFPYDLVNKGFILLNINDAHQKSMCECLNPFALVFVND